MLTLLLCAAIAARLTAPPVAVAPFRNLSADKDLVFLEHGVAETMTADLRRAGVAVVERAQLHEALRQLDANAKEDVARAVSAGRVVGAKSVVVGSAQRQGPLVRLVARVVVTETGEVKEAATATGPRDDIFAVQDQLVRALVGKAPRARPRPPRVQSYRRLGDALAAAPAAPAALAAPLEAIAVEDPDFVYAHDALAALYDRTLSGRVDDTAAAAALDERTRALLAIVEDRAVPAERRARSARR